MLLAALKAPAFIFRYLGLVFGKVLRPNDSVETGHEFEYQTSLISVSAVHELMEER